MKTYELIKIDDFNWPSLPPVSIWDSIESLTDFDYPWREEQPLLTEFKSFYTDSHVYFHYVVQDPEIEAKIASWPDRPVVDSDRVEIFFRKDTQMRPYFCLEIDSRGRVLDYVADFHRQFDYDWQWPEGQLAVSGKVTDQGYKVTAGVSIASLQQLGVWHPDRLEIGLFRAEYLFDKQGRHQDVKWISWINPDSKHPDFHIPSAFGRFFWG